MTIYSILVSLIVAMRPSEPDVASRLASVAAAISEQSAVAPVFEGDDGAKRTALLLLAIARHESGLRAEVGDCRVRGDHGRSLGYFQLHRGMAWHGYSAEEICADEQLQTRLALRTLHAQRARGVTSASGLLRAYASGSAGRDSRAARELTADYERAVQRAEAL